MVPGTWCSQSCVLLALAGAFLAATCEGMTPVKSSPPQLCAISVDPSDLNGLSKAQQAVRRLLVSQGNASLQRDIVVCLLPGRHDVSAAPLQFGPEDGPAQGGGGGGGGGGRVIWRADENNTVVSGGVQVKGWKPSEQLGGSGQQQVFVAAVPKGVIGGSVLRQLWVGGRRAERVVHHRRHKAANGTLTFPNMAAWVSSGGNEVGFSVLPGEVIPASWAANSTASIEFTWLANIANWIQPRCTIASVDCQAGNITLAAPCGKFLVQRNGGKLPPSPETIEAAAPDPHVPMLPG